MSLEEELEALVDKHGLVHVLRWLTAICYAKAWQDRNAAKTWNKAAIVLVKAADKVDTLRLPSR